MSKKLFNQVLETIVRNSNIKTQETIFKNEHKCKAFADDLNILAKTRQRLKKKL